VRRRAPQFVLAAAVGVVSLLVAAPAWAHVTVHADDPVRGASDVAVMFRTPNEENNAATVRLQVFFPTAKPLLDVLVEPHPGWSATTKTATLAHPVTTDDGSITSAVSEVTWQANSTTDGLQPGEADDFTIICGQLPDTPSVTFRALQTYSNGDVVKWIETAAPGADEPEHPAPVLALAGVGDSGSTVSSTGDGMNMSPTSSTTTIMAGPAASTSNEDDSHDIAATALVISLIALAAALLSRRRRS
jgi:periplasmic copper chaperone A